MFDHSLQEPEEISLQKKSTKVGFLFVFSRDFGYYARENNLSKYDFIEYSSIK